MTLLKSSSSSSITDIRENFQQNLGFRKVHGQLMKRAESLMEVFLMIDQH